MEFSLLCPTRGRPQDMERLWESALSTAEKKESLEILFYVDHDDIPSQEKGAELVKKYGDQVKIIHGPKIVFSKMWNICCEAASADILLCCGDDLIFRTDLWDKMVLSVFKHFPDKIVMVYGKDGIQDIKLATHPFLHRKWVETVGYFFPPHFEFGYNDTWITDVAMKLKRAVFIENLFIEHMHPAVGKAPWDETYRARIGLVAQNRQKFNELTPRRMEDVAKLKAYIEEQDHENRVSGIGEAGPTGRPGY